LDKKNQHQDFFIELTLKLLELTVISLKATSIEPGQTTLPCSLARFVIVSHFLHFAIEISLIFEWTVPN
jgi:hypothetical protein